MSPVSRRLGLGEEQGLTMEQIDVLVAGAGIGGTSAALAAARLGARVVLAEAAPAIGGTGVHSAVGLICTWFDRSGRPINLGIHRELFPDIYRQPVTRVQTYDERALATRYRDLTAAEPNLRVRTGAAVTRVEAKDGRVVAVELADGGRFAPRMVVDGTADGALAALAGAEFEFGRPGDRALQPATLTFSVADVDFAAFGVGDLYEWGNLTSAWDQLRPAFEERQRDGRCTIAKSGVLFFPLPDGHTLLFNQTRVHGVDPTDPAAVAAATAEARRQIDGFLPVLAGHPAFARATPPRISARLGVREGRRILGDYQLTEADCLGEARFADMVAACGYAIDIHDPAGGGTRLVGIPGSGYYHIPLRCLTARRYANLLMGSRCISGTHEAHSSYRVMAPVSAIGQAAGTAAALAVAQQAEDVREVGASRVRAALAESGQFIEG